MFSLKDFSSINMRYFKVLKINFFCITLQSNNTLHYWHLIAHDYGQAKSIEILHRHGDSGEYHFHGRACTLKEAINSIKDHDRFQLTVRKRR